MMLLLWLMMMPVDAREGLKWPGFEKLGEGFEVKDNLLRVYYSVSGV